MAKAKKYKKKISLEEKLRAKVKELPHMKGVKNDYDKFNLPFLRKEGDKVFNGEYDVTNVPDKLYGVPSGFEEIGINDYLVYRPIPEELLNWRKLPNFHPDSLDMENWYNDLIKFCMHGVFIDGEYWNPFMVYWLNVFVFPVYNIDEYGDATDDFTPNHPYYCNIDRYIFDILWKAELQRKDFSLMGARGFGKDLYNDTVIPTPTSGYRFFGELQVGDSVFAGDGSPTKVVAIREYDRKPMVDFKLADGRSISSGTGHLWNVLVEGNDEIQTLESIQIMDLINVEGLEVRIPAGGAVEYDISDLPKRKFRAFSSARNIQIFNWGDIPTNFKFAPKKVRLNFIMGFLVGAPETIHEFEGTVLVKLGRKYSKYRGSLISMIRSLGIRVDEFKNKLKLRVHIGSYKIDTDDYINIFKKSLVADCDLRPEELLDRKSVPIISCKTTSGREVGSRCIEVEHHTNTYLASDFIVTHNSFIAGNVIDREFRLIPNSLTLISSTNDETTSEAWSKMEECMNSINIEHRALKHRLLNDSLSEKYSGQTIELPDGTIEYQGYLAKIGKIVYGKNSGKTRGSRPSKQLVEEFASFPPPSQKGSLKACIGESRGSWWVGSVKKCTVMYTGTGGTAENDEAKDVFLDPDAYGILPTYDWSKKGTGVFIPVHVKWSGTWEETGCPDIARAEAEVDETREKVRSDPKAYLSLTQEYPKTIQEVFAKRGTNIFNQDKIAEQRTTIEFGDKIPKPGRGFLKWEYSQVGRIIGVSWESAPTNGDIEILEHPHWLREDVAPEDRIPMDDLYVSGLDSIDQGIGDSSTAIDNIKGSELAMLVKKRIVEGGYHSFTSNLYVAKYNKRSYDVRDDWDNALKLTVYFNAKVNIEFTKIGIVGHFRDKGFYSMLMKRPSIALTGSNPKKATTLIGTQASTNVIDHMDHKISVYIDDHSTDIWFLDVLEQLQEYDRNNRTKFDYVIAMGLAELADEDLMGKFAKVKRPESNELKLFGYYTDPSTGFKKFGVIGNDKTAQEELDAGIRAENEEFMKNGGVRWIEVDETGKERYMY